MATVHMQDANAGTRASRLRPLEATDLASLGDLDCAYAARTGTPPHVNRASLHFFARSGHSFVAEDEEGVAVGFVLAHTVWTGGEASLRLERLVAADGKATPEATGTLAMLADAVVKSAYDAGVYELRAESPMTDVALIEALESASFASEPVVTLRRRLGSGAPLGAPR